MKQYSLLIGFVCITNLLSLGQDSEKSFRDEFTFSLNQTVQPDYKIEPRYSFGFSINHVFMAKKTANILFGVEYNCIRFHTDLSNQEFYYGSADLNYKLHYLSVPLGFRVNLQHHPSIFLETGVYMDIMLNSNVQGTTQTFVRYKYGYLKYDPIEIDEPTPIESNTGVYFGVGVKVPISKFELLIKPDFKLGFGHTPIGKSEFYNLYYRINVGLSF